MIDFSTIEDVKIRKYFFVQEAICFECTNSEHKTPSHVFDNLNAAGSKERQKLESLVNDTKLKLDECVKTNTDLENALSELQIQHDSAKDLINETFQVGKASLRKSGIFLYFSNIPTCSGYELLMLVP